MFIYVRMYTAIRPAEEAAQQAMTAVLHARANSLSPNRANGGGPGFLCVVRGCMCTYSNTCLYLYIHIFIYVFIHMYTCVE